MLGHSIIAIVDDDAALLESMMMLLQVHGHKVATYNGASEFLEDRNTKFACLVTDQHMPKMKGLELVAHLFAEGRRIPSLLMTSSPLPDVLEGAAALGIQVIEKPTDVNVLLKFISIYIKENNPTNPQEPTPPGA